MVRAKTVIVTGMVLLSLVAVVAGNCLAQVGTANTGKTPAKKEMKVVETPDSFRSGNAEVLVLRFENENPTAAKQPAVLLLPGCDGLEQMEAYRYVAKSLVESGYIVVLVSYYDRTMTPNQVPAKQREDFVRWLDGNAKNETNNAAREHFDGWIETVGDAVAYTRQLPNVDAERVGLVGCSLGGFLAVSAAANKNLPVHAVVELFGGLPEEKRKGLRTLPPTLILHGEEDTVVCVKEAHALHGLLLQRKQTVEVEIYPGVGHVFIRPGQEKPDCLVVMQAMSRMKEFLNKNLQRSATQTVKQ